MRVEIIAFLVIIAVIIIVILFASPSKKASVASGKKKESVTCKCKKHYGECPDPCLQCPDCICNCGSVNCSVDCPCPEPKVTICHHPNSNPNTWNTIDAAVSSLPAHYGHGDTVGPCVFPQ